MSAENHPARQYHGVMVSSTFKDLKDHRAALISTIQKEAFASVVMEKDTAKADGDVIDSSLQMVRDASAYIGLISMRYGQIPVDPIRNPNNLSITELEFNEAQRIKRPILLFIMADEHLIPKADIERDPVKEAKLDAFRERAKESGPDSLVNRVYDTFSSLEDFKEKIPHAVAGLRRLLDKETTPQAAPPPSPSDPIPAPPAFYAEPRYAASHKFVGREAELNLLSDWASPADPYPILLFDAIGGSGKSMLTWHWTTNQATQLRPDWSGRFWYSFYERGAVMADFCRHAIAYITRQPVEKFSKLKTPALGRLLLHHLQTHRWLFVLDGLERVLVAYNRTDAAELSHEDDANPTDQIAKRDPCAAIRPEDDDLLRALSTASPSKLLITSRIPPRAILNSSDQEIPGVRRAPLRGLRPSDAELLIRSCGVRGNSQSIQSYLQSHCDCHPLTTGVLAGLIRNYLPDKGNFDAWLADPDYGGQLNFAELNLVQKRNHILNAAISGLSPKSRRLLSLLALLSEAVDSATLGALNPFLPNEPEKAAMPDLPLIESWMSDEWKQWVQQEYELALQRRKNYERALVDWQGLQQIKIARQQLANRIRDLQVRGLVQYDDLAKRYDLHPVVRGCAAAAMHSEEKLNYGQRLVDHFSSRPHNPYEQAETMEDVGDGLHIVRTLLKMGRYQLAAEAYVGDLANALYFNLAAHSEDLAILRPFFDKGWTELPSEVDEHTGSSLQAHAGMALAEVGETQEALSVFSASISRSLREANWVTLMSRMRNFGNILLKTNRSAQVSRTVHWRIELATILGNKELAFIASLDQFVLATSLGQFEEAHAIWKSLSTMGREWARYTYRPGEAETSYIRLCAKQNALTEELLANSERVAKKGKNRHCLQVLHRVRGQWRLQQEDWSRAVESLQEAVAMARAVDQSDETAETLLATAKLHLGQLDEPKKEAQRLAKLAQPSHQALGELWLAIGDKEQASRHALAAYEDAWADGEPYVFRYDLNQAKVLLERLHTDIPKLPVYDQIRQEKFPWEEDLIASIAKLREEREAEQVPPPSLKRRRNRQPSSKLKEPSNTSTRIP